MAKSGNPFMKVDMLGCVRAVHVPISHAFLPIFEAVINSIQSTEERFGDAVSKKGAVNIVITRSGQSNIPGIVGRTPELAIDSVEIIDNGMGFNQTNFDSFETAYTTAKADKGGKGVGRFSWLVVFRRAEIDSTFEKDSSWYQRKFLFQHTKEGIENHNSSLIENNKDLRTCVRLSGVREKYNKALRKSIDAIAENLFEHCFPYFVVGHCPKVILTDKSADNTETVVINDKLNELKIYDPTDLSVGQYLLKIQHVQQAFKGNRRHIAHLCANQQQVETFSLSQVSELGNEPFCNETGSTVVHHVFVSGDILDENVDTARTHLILPEDDPLFASAGELDMRTLREAIGKNVNEYLESILKKERAENLEKIKEHIQTKQPEYRILISQREDDLQKVKWIPDERKLDEALYRVQQGWDLDNRKKQANIEIALAKNDVDVDKFAEELYKVVEENNKLGQANLVRYVTKRRAVLNIINQLISRTQGPALEKHIHNIVFPMKKTGDDIAYEDHNLWLVDDTLSFYEFLSSDIEFSKNKVEIVDSSRRPDILAFKNGDPFQHVAIVEFKRPDRDDENPVQQLVEYGQMLRKGGKADAQGRTLPGLAKNVRIDAYAVVTLTPKMETSLEISPGDIQKVENDWRWYGTVSNLNMTIEVLDYRAFIRRAEQRNHAFFTKLGLK